MIGAIVGDVLGSTWTSDRDRKRLKRAPLLEETSNYTDASVMVMAVTRWAIDDGLDQDLVAALKSVPTEYPTIYDNRFFTWVSRDDVVSYGGLDNGAAVRAAGIAWAVDSVDKARDMATRSATVTHDEDAVFAAEAVAVAVRMALEGASPSTIMTKLKIDYGYGGYGIEKPIERMAEIDFFSDAANLSVPFALGCALRSVSFEGAIRNVISLGGNSSRQAAIAGALAEAIHGIPEKIEVSALDQMSTFTETGRRLVLEIRSVRDRMGPVRRPRRLATLGRTVRSLVSDRLP